jgi:hypothetical protein
MTTSPTDHTETADQAVRQSAWDKALWLHDQMTDALARAAGGPGGAGYRDPHAAGDAGEFRTRLYAIITEHDFWDTRVDPLGLSYFERRAAAWLLPDVDRAHCTHDSATCEVHWGRRFVGAGGGPCRDGRTSATEAGVL